MNNNNNNNEINLNHLEKIIERIRSITKMKQIYLKEKQKDENNNPFNKINKITLFEGIEKVELFWKVFRNKTIFKKIMSFMNKQFSSTYDSIISAEKLIKYNQFGILKEKVKRNCRYFNFEDNLLTMDVEEFNFKPTIDDLKLSIIRGSNKFIKYLLNKQQQQIKNNFKLSKNHLENLHDIKYNFSDYSNGLLFKGLYCFYKNYKYFNKNQSHHPLNEFSSLKIISNFEKINQNLTLKQLITIVKLVLILINNNNNNENENEQTNNIYYIKNNSTIILNLIEKFKNKLNKEKLKSKLDDPINTNENKKFIKKLMDFYCSIWNKYNLPLCFYLGYYSLDENQLKDLTLEIKENQDNNPRIFNITSFFNDNSFQIYY
ncbi:hypothetical protein ACTFIY_011296 [Dictyostelium cf. discoideum]